MLSIIITFIIVSRASTVGIKAFSAPHTTPAPTGLGMHRKLGEDRAGTLPPIDLRDISIPYSFMLNVRKLGKKEDGRDIQSNCFCLPSSHYM